MKLRDAYYRFGLQRLNYKSKEDLYENLYLRALTDSYGRIKKATAHENEIRDRFVWDMENENPLTKKLIQEDILQLDFEKSHFVSETEKRRTDIVFFISGFGKFIIECKRLFNETSKNNKYFEDGLKRFIDLKYSEKEGYAGMMGFIVSGDILMITKELNTKVREYFLASSQYNLLNKDCVDWKYSFQSAHYRVNNSRIHIYHLFFEFSE